MSWQILIGLHVAFSTIYALLFRKVAQEFPDTPRLSMALIYLLVIFPLGLVAAFFQGGIDINLSLQTWILLVLGGILFTGFSVFGYMANSHVDATQFAVIQNTQAVFTIIVSGLLLGEQLSFEQLIGVAMLVVGAIVVSVKGFNRSTFRFSKWNDFGFICWCSFFQRKVLARTDESANLLCFWLGSTDVSHVLSCWKGMATDY